ncbi:MAG TPA: ATP-binding cassette domain-containing protein, partial [Eubacteriales bacterium]|nr:ATP-binding cassette domain-containing protein [Eubacteriales bacterium]
MKNVIIEMRGISKVYDNGIIANENASIEVAEGEIHALAGENGAGKSTLMKILFGLEKPTSGEIFVRGEKVSISSPVDAAKYGVGMVHQHFMLVNELSVLDNVILGNEVVKKGLLDRSAARKKLVELTEKYGMS